MLWTCLIRVFDQFFHHLFPFQHTEVLVLDFGEFRCKFPNSFLRWLFGCEGRGPQIILLEVGEGSLFLNRKGARGGGFNQPSIFFVSAAVKAIKAHGRLF